MALFKILKCFLKGGKMDLWLQESHALQGPY
jgi:hypothetical protein